MQTHTPLLIPGSVDSHISPFNPDVLSNTRSLISHRKEEGLPPLSHLEVPDGGILPHTFPLTLSARLPHSLRFPARDGVRICVCPLPSTAGGV